jgi:hypothetical protein
MVVCLLALLSGCDGGIFGTGDGNDLVTDVGASPDSGAPGTDNPGTDHPGQTPEMPTTGVDPDDNSPPGSGGQSEGFTQVGFENLLVASTIVEPQLSLVNLSTLDLDVQVSPGSDDMFDAAFDSGFDSGFDPVFDTPVAAGTASRRQGLPLAADGLRILATRSGESVWLLSPLNLGAYTVTTLVSRSAVDASTNQPVSTTDTAEVNGVEVTALPTLLSADPGMVLVRILQTTPLDSADTAARMILVPSDTSPGSSEVDLGRVSAAGFVVGAEYHSVAPGSYLLTDTLGRFPPEPLDVAAGEVYTLIINGIPATVLRLRDSDARSSSSPTQ